MLIDEALPTFDATIIEHLVVDAKPDTVYEVARGLDFLQVHSPMVDAVMLLRGLPARVGRRLGRGPSAVPPPTMRLADLFDGSTDGDGLEDWVALGEAPGRELVFGAIGKIWQADIDWKSIRGDEFRDFAEADQAKIAAGFSIRSYGQHRTLLSYEARTAGTDAAARRKFMRYWWAVRPFVRIVMLAALATIKNQAETPDLTGRGPG